MPGNTTRATLRSIGTRLLLAAVCVPLFLGLAASFRAHALGSTWLVGSAILLIFGLFVFRKEPESRLNRAFLYFSLCYSGYLLLVYLLHLATVVGLHRVVAGVWLLRHLLLLIPPATVYFTCRFLKGGSRLMLVCSGLALLCMLPLMIANLTGAYVTEYRRVQWTYVPGGDTRLYALSALFSIFWVTFSAAAVFARCFRTSDRERRPHYILFLVGWGISAIFAILGFLPAFKRMWFPSFVGLTWMLFPLMTGIAIVRFSMFDIKVVIRRTLPYALGTALIGVLYAACLAGLERLGAAAEFMPRGANWVLLLILMGFGFQPVLELLQALLDRAFFRAEAEMDRFLAEAGTRYATSESAQALAGTLAHDAAGALKLEGALVLLGEDRVACAVSRPEAKRARGFEGLAMPAYDAGDELLELKNGDDIEVLTALGKLNVRLAAPFGGEGTRGLLACMEKKSHAEFSPRDRMFLRALAAQAGTALARLEAREDADQLQRLTDAVFESMTNAVAVLEPNGRVHSCNPAFERMFAISAGGEKHLPWLTAASLDADSAPCEIETEEGIFLVSSRPLEGAGRSGRRVVVLVDVTELRRLQEVDRRRKALAELGATISSINHEIGNIISPLNHYIARARRTAAPGEVGECLDAAAERLRMLQSLSGELREYYREPVLSPRRVPLVELVESALADVRSGAGERWVAPRLENLDFEITADLQKMKQVFLNLAKNAWEAMSEIECPEWAVTAEHTDGLARISVSDSGPGIPPGKLERLFEPFYTTKKERGTGLGLAIARRIVEAHGATINVESETGRGTTVTITWPRG